MPPLWLQPLGLAVRLARMAQRGKLIVLEGIDGAGKGTQASLLAHTMETRGVPFVRLGFPHYQSSFGRLIGKFLNGDFGPLDSIDPHFSALLYAGDRLEAKPRLVQALGAGQTVLLDRYIASNMAHQGARVPLSQRDEFIAWLRHLEYEIYGLPAEDLVIYLRLDATHAHRLVGSKQPRTYTTLTRDLQESDLSHLEKAAAIYDQLAAQSNWITVDCFEPGTGVHRSPEQIHSSILAALDSHARTGSTAQR